MNKEIKVSGKIVDILNRKIYPGIVTIKDKKIENIEETEEVVDEVYILPGLVDSHIHIESSMLTPQMFAKEAVRHGTVATVSDPHEIANVLGEEGVDFMVKDGEQVPFKFYFGVPSCVPATPFETSGAVIDAKKVTELIQKKYHPFLAEMMNFPGVLNNDPEVMQKLKAAKDANKPIDGHAPGLRGGEAQQYIDAGITTDHECSDIEEAQERINMGMKIQIREGSAAKDFNNLYPLISQFPEQVMLCSDDKHPDDLIESHINGLIRKGIKNGLDIFDLLNAAVVNPVQHYNLDVGMLRKDDPADLIVLDSLEKFNVLKTIINGEVVYEQNKSLITPSGINEINVMKANPLTEKDIQIEDKGLPVKVIEAMDTSLYTSSTESFPFVSKGLLISDAGSDVLKIVVYNRYKQSRPSVGFIKNFHLQRGAIASSIAHDSHNLIAVGVEDKEIVKAINHLIEQGGGIVLTDQDNIQGLPLEIAGLMTHQPAEDVAKRYKELTRRVQDMGCTFTSPFMTLSFMALPVIPELKITDQGLFDVQKFEYTDLHAYKN